MDLFDAVARRRMTRDFRDEPLEVSVVDSVIDAGRRAPSAGHAQAREFLVLEGADRDRYWDITLPPTARDAFPWPGLLRAPVLCVVVVEPDGYLRRYREADKAHTGLGEGTERWRVPFWFVDGGAAAEAMLLAAAARGIGACLFGLFEHEPAVLSSFGVPEGWRAVCTIALGHRGDGDRRSRSAARGRRSLDEVIHRGRW